MQGLGFGQQRTVLYFPFQSIGLHGENIGVRLSVKAERRAGRDKPYFAGLVQIIFTFHLPPIYISCHGTKLGPFTLPARE